MCGLLVLVVRLCLQSALLHLCSCSGEAHYLMMLSVLFRGHVAHLDDDDGDDDDSKQ